MASRTLSVVITGDAKDAQRAFQSVEGGTDSFQKKLGSVGKSMQAFGGNMTRYVTLPIVAGLALATKAAIAEEQEIAKLDQVLKNSTVVTDKQRQAVEKQITAWQNATGIADGKLRPAVSNLVVAGLSWEKTQKMMSVAMDISAAKGVTVESVTKAMARATQGNTTSLSRMGVQVRDANGEMLSFDQILKNASDTMGGSAARAAKTAAGRMAILKARFADLVEQIGATLIPIIEKLVAGFGKILTKFQGLSPQLQKFIVIVALAAAALGPLLILFGSLATALAAISLPVVATIALFAALTAAVILLYTHWDQVWTWMKEHPAIAAIIVLLTGPVSIPILLLVGLFKLMGGHWDEVWNAMKSVAETVWPVLETIFNAIDTAIFAVGTAVRWLYDRWADAWPAIQSVLQSAWSVISPILDAQVWAIRAIIDAAVFLANGAASWFGGFVNGAQQLWGAVDGPLHAVLNILRRIIDAAQSAKNFLGKVGGAVTPDFTPGFDIPGVPFGAEGAIVNRPTLALIGEAGPEALVPLNRSPGNGPLPSGGGGATYVAVSIPWLPGLADLIVKEINQKARGGPVFISTAVA
jgi:phage-related protein